MFPVKGWITGSLSMLSRQTRLLFWGSPQCTMLSRPGQSLQKFGLPDEKR